MFLVASRFPFTLCQTHDFWIGVVVVCFVLFLLHKTNSQWCEFQRYSWFTFEWVNAINEWREALTVKSTDKSVPSNRMTLHWIKFLFDTIRCGFIWLAVFWCCWPSVVATRFSPALVFRPLRLLKNRNIFSNIFVSCTSNSLPNGITKIVVDRAIRINSLVLPHTYDCTIFRWSKFLLLVVRFYRQRPSYRN